MERIAEHKRVAVERSVREIYLLEPTPEHIALVESLPQHPSWQGPLWIDARGDQEELFRRIEAAGERWLGCTHLSPHNLLMVSCPAGGWYFLFQRSQGCGSEPLVVGPIESDLQGGYPVGPNGLFAEEILEPLPADTFEAN